MRREYAYLFPRFNLILRAGRGALVRVGTFHYPARLIQNLNGSWRIKLWRENVLPMSAEFVAGGIYTVALTEIVDSLWQNRAQRRIVRVCEYYSPTSNFH